MEIGGMPALAWTLRAAKTAKNVDDVWLAIPRKERDLAWVAVANNINCWCGSEHDVLQRFRETASAAKADLVVRLTADCPFLDPWMIDQCVERECDSTEFWPDGLDVQVFRPHMLEHGDKEHVVGPMWVRPQLPCPEGNLRNVRCTLDTPEDLRVLRLAADTMPTVNRPPTWSETVAAVSAVRRALAAGEKAYSSGEPNVFEGLQSLAE